MTSNEAIKATGRRKCAIACVKLVKGKGRIFVNGKTLLSYFGNHPTFEMNIFKPLALTDNTTSFDIQVRTFGGGVSAQADAIKHGISKALLEYNPEYKKVLREEGLLTRDARVKERKKYGRKRARKRFQFSKR